MREEVRDIERLNHMIEAINVLVNYKEHHTLEDARHVLVHGYYKIRPDQLWETIVTDIPAIKPIIEQLILEEKSK